MGQNRITFEQYIGFTRRKELLENKKVKIPGMKIFSFCFLTLFVIVWLFPFLILLFGSLRSGNDATFYPKQLFDPPTGYTFENFEFLLTGKFPESMQGGGSTIKDVRLGNWFLNTCVNAIGGTMIYLFVASIAAYAFTFIDWKFRNLIFAILVATLVIPGAATTVGNQSLVYDMGLNNSIFALIIPGLGGVYGMYLIRTFFTSIPKDLIESARMDGYGNFKIYCKIVLPLGKTVLFVQGLFGFMGGWNDLVWPNMLFRAKDSYLWTLQVGISYLTQTYRASSQVGFSLASGVLCVLPVLVVYLLAQRYIIEGMASAGIKK